MLSYGGDQISLKQHERFQQSVQYKDESSKGEEERNRKQKNKSV